MTKYKIKIKIDIEASHQDWIAFKVLVERLTGSKEQSVCVCSFIRPDHVSPFIMNLSVVKSQSLLLYPRQQPTGGHFIACIVYSKVKSSVRRALYSKGGQMYSVYIQECNQTTTRLYPRHSDYIYIEASPDPETETDK